MVALEVSSLPVNVLLEITFQDDFGTDTHGPCLVKEGVLLYKDLETLKLTPVLTKLPIVSWTLWKSQERFSIFDGESPMDDD